MTKTDGSTSITASYDYNGQISKITRDGVSLSYTYDSLGNVSSETLPENAIYTYTNYKLGTPQNEVQPDSISVSRIVDDVGNIISETDGEGFTTRFTYDAISRVTSVIPPVGAATYTSYTPSSMVQRRGPLVVTSLLDGFGRVMSETKGGITITRQYDGYGRLTFESDPDASTGTKYQYDALGRVVRLTHADKTSKSTVYGAGTRIVTDELGNATGYKYRGYGDSREIHLIGISLPESAANISIARDGRDQVVSVS
nr:RHS repeat protein [Pseudomonas sp. WS 5051]